MISSDATAVRHNRRRRILFRTVAVVLGLSVAFVVLEVFCRVYEPLQMRVQGGRIVLPVNVTRRFSNDRIEKIDAEIVHSRNSLGFRGPEPPDDFEEHLTIVAVGGSTTECYYLSDGFTWPQQLGARLTKRHPKSWVNNAGLDGQSTFGHAHLLDQYLVDLKPDVILFLIGANDVGLAQAAIHDTAMDPDKTGPRTFSSGMWQSLVEHSALFAIADNIRRSAAAREAGVVHGNVTHEQLQLDADAEILLSDHERAALLQQHRTNFLPDYRKRTRSLIETCTAHGIRPVLITQPALYGDAIDPTTGVDLSRVTVGSMNGGVRWRILRLYNEATKAVAAEHDVTVIDLASLMPKDSRYYYDYHHYTNDGAELIGKLIDKAISEEL